MAEYLNMSLDDVIKVSRKDSNNKNEYRKFSTNRINKKPIRKFNNLQVQIFFKADVVKSFFIKASSFKGNPKFSTKPKILTIEKQGDQSKLNFRRLRIENLDRNIDNSELRVIINKFSQILNPIKPRNLNFLLIYKKYIDQK